MSTRVLTHGHAGYTRDCRCEACRAGAAKYKREWRARMRSVEAFDRRFMCPWCGSTFARMDMADRHEDSCPVRFPVHETWRSK